jgi:hypothetical protein
MKMAIYTNTSAIYTDTIASYTDTMAAYTDTMAVYTDTMAACTDTMAAYTDTMADYTGTMTGYTGTMTIYTDTPATYIDTQYIFKNQNGKIFRIHLYLHKYRSKYFLCKTRKKTKLGTLSLRVSLCSPCPLWLNIILRIMCLEMKNK